jgi:Protein of unknown function (DUF3990)
MPVLYPPPPWAGAPFSQYVELWHGCLKGDVKSIRKGIDPLRGDPRSDFGRGFYTSTVKQQARHWAWRRWELSQQQQLRRVSPVVVRFRVPLHRLASLNSLHFVQGGYDSDRFWSFVHHCRQSTRSYVQSHAHPTRIPPNDWYDVVWGPVAAFWTQRVAMAGADQISFHTAAGATVLNEAIANSDSDAFRVFRVRPRR